VVLPMRVLMRLDDAGKIVLAVRVRREVKFAGAQVFNPMHPLADAAGCLARNLKEGCVVIEPAEVTAELLKIEIRVWQQIGLVQHERADLVKEQGIFRRLVVAFGHAENADLRGLAEIELSGTRDIADVLNEQQIDLIQIQFAETSLHQRRFKMAGATREQLHHGHAEFFDAFGVSCGSDVTLKRGDAIATIEKRDCAFQQ
jgi:hypothetical protein